MPDITLYFLNSSRAIRVAWLLEELGLPYDLVSADRAANGLAPPEFKAKIPVPLGKSPTLQDGDRIVTESGSIIEYLCEEYDTAHRLMPREPQLRARVREWLHAAEGTFLLHAMAVLYARWNIPEAASGWLEEMTSKMGKNVQNDLSWLEQVLKHQRERGADWIVGDGLTVADMQMQFSVQFMYERKLEVGAPGQFPEVEAWLQRTTEVRSYRQAVSRTGYTLDGDFRK